MKETDNFGLKKFAVEPLVRNVLIISFYIGVALGVGFMKGFHELSVHNNNAHFTRAEYERLKLQMSLSEVESILGRGIETEQSESVSIFIWKNSDGYLIKVTFEDNRLISKSQSVI